MHNTRLHLNSIFFFLNVSRNQNDLIRMFFFKNYSYYVKLSRIFRLNHGSKQFYFPFCLGKCNPIFAAITNELTKSLKYYNQNIKILIINQKYIIKNI